MVVSRGPDTSIHISYGLSVILVLSSSSPTWADCDDVIQDCDVLAFHGECLVTPGWTNCNCSLACDATIQCLDTETSDTDCLCREWAGLGYFEDDPDLYNVTCPSTFELRDEIVCDADPPMSISHGSVNTDTLSPDTVIQPYRFLHTVTFECEAGYTFTGTRPPSVTCNDDGDWMWGYYNDDTTCSELIDCHEPNNTRTDVVVNVTDTTYNATATYRCLDDVTFTLTCGEDGVWQGPEVTCKDAQPMGNYSSFDPAPREAEFAAVIGSLGLLITSMFIGLFVCLDCVKLKIDLRRGWYNSRPCRKCIRRRIRVKAARDGPTVDPSHVEEDTLGEVNNASSDGHGALCDVGVENEAVKTNDDSERL